LASAYGIIKNHGGIIKVFSRQGEGTAFEIFLPASEKKAVKEPEDILKVTKGSETILLVDDESMILKVGRQLLEKIGYNVLLARGGLEALKIYEKEKTNIDLVILDMVMPKMSGGETFDRLKTINPEVRVLLSSGYSLNEQSQEMADRGCAGFIQKPFSITVLSQKLREILGQRDGQ
jgi:CheY-like chemotaxis protein